MYSSMWRKVILSILILAIISGSSGCQAVGEVERGLQNFRDGMATLPDRVSQALVNLLGGIRNVGAALVDSMRDMFSGMTGH